MTEYMQLHQLITRPGDGTNELVQYLKSLHAVEPVATKTLHAVDHGGHTLLMVALKYRKQERATALLEHGSDVRRTNNAGWKARFGEPAAPRRSRTSSFANLLDLCR